MNTFQKIMFHIRRLKKLWAVTDMVEALFKCLRKNFRWKDEVYENW